MGDGFRTGWQESDVFLILRVEEGWADENCPPNTLIVNTDPSRTDILNVLRTSVTCLALLLDSCVTQFPVEGHIARSVRQRMAPGAQVSY